MEFTLVIVHMLTVGTQLEAMNVFVNLATLEMEALASLLVLFLV